MDKKIENFLKHFETDNYDVEEWFIRFLYNEESSLYNPDEEMVSDEIAPNSFDFHRRNKALMTIKEFQEMTLKKMFEYQDKGINAELILYVSSKLELVDQEEFIKDLLKLPKTIILNDCMHESFLELLEEMKK